MGLGPGFAIATALYARWGVSLPTYLILKYGSVFKIENLSIFRSQDPLARVLCVEGDSAFGFSGMEVETMARS